MQLALSTPPTGPSSFIDHSKNAWKRTIDQVINCEGFFFLYSAFAGDIIACTLDIYICNKTLFGKKKSLIIKLIEMYSTIVKENPSKYWLIMHKKNTRKA